MPRSVRGITELYHLLIGLDVSESDIFIKKVMLSLSRLSYYEASHNRRDNITFLIFSVFMVLIIKYVAYYKNILNFSRSFVKKM